ncbi:MAG: hypothetical protein H7336_05570 [Bacteriovorax sp.]|nr:hypothetical protein [Bacteriovorax sp.]
MKLLLALSFSLFASASMACTDFSGTYRDESSATYNVSQSGCATVTVNSSEGTETIIADGQYRVTSEDEQVRVTSAATFVGANLTIDGIVEYKVTLPPQVPADKIPARVVTIYTLDSAGNLVMNLSVLNSSNQVIAQGTMTQQRI